MPRAFIPYLQNIFNSKTSSEYKKAISRSIPACESKEQEFFESIFQATYYFHTTIIGFKDGENIFNSLFTFLTAISTWLNDTKEWSKTEFRPGEASLFSMNNELKKLLLYKNYHNYLAAGIIQLFGFRNIEILLLETSGSFGPTDKSKISYDCHKDLFGALTMLKNIANQFYFGSMKTFESCKLFFVHGAGETLYLWGLRFEPKGSNFG